MHLYFKRIAGCNTTSTCLIRSMPLTIYFNRFIGHTNSMLCRIHGLLVDYIRIILLYRKYQKLVSDRIGRGLPDLKRLPCTDFDIEGFGP